MKIIAIGRNYAEHIAELNNETPDEPVIFTKPDTALLRNNEPFYFPEYSKEVHYEVEIVLKINREGKYIAEKFAHKYYDEIAVGIDFTARDLQQKAKFCQLVGLRPQDYQKCLAKAQAYSYIRPPANTASTARR